MVDFKKVRKFCYRNSYTFGAIAIIVIFIALLTVSCTSATWDKGAIVNKNVSDKVVTTTPTIIEKEVIVEVEKEPVYFEDTEFFDMTKSQLNERIEKINALINSAEALDMGNTTLVAQAHEELNRINNALETGSYLYPYSNDELNILAYMMYDEAGDSIFDDEEQLLVGCVLENRKNMGGINQKMIDPSLLDVINERMQYAIGVRYNYAFNLSKVNLDKIPERCYNNARKVLEHEYTCPDNVVYQSLEKQGSGVYKSFYHNTPYYNTTYFCYL